MANKAELQKMLADIQAQLAHCDCDGENIFLHDDDAADQVTLVLTSLREQPGVVPMKHGEWQYFIEGKMAGYGDAVRLEVRKRRDSSVKMSRAFSPAFKTERDAANAINAVGPAVIMKAMRTLAWG